MTCWVDEISGFLRVGLSKRGSFGMQESLSSEESDVSVWFSWLPRQTGSFGYFIPRDQRT